MMTSTNAKNSSAHLDNTAETNQTPNNSNNAGTNGHPWWQWFFLYPAFGIAILTAMPEWISGVERLIDKFTNAKDYEETQLTKFMEKNPECVRTPSRWYEVSGNTKVDGTICNQTGDVWLVINVEGETVHKGIAIADIIKSRFSLTDFFSTQAIASTPGNSISFSSTPMETERNSKKFTKMSEAFAVVVCQKFQGSLILRHVRVNNICYDEEINSQNGVLQSRTQVPCRSSC